MTNATTQNFLKVMSEFVWPEPPTQSFRLYYNDDGSPKFYSMDQIDGNYIEVDSTIFAIRPWNVKVVDQKLCFIQPAVVVSKLKPNQIQGTPCHPRDVCVVVSETQPYVKWELIKNEVS
jgi:hypothetical protein